MTEQRFIKWEEAEDAIRKIVKNKYEKTAEIYEPVLNEFGRVLFTIFYDNYTSGVDFEPNIEEMKEGYAKDIARLTFEQVKKAWE